MTNIRRYFKKGNLYFTTHVTYRRIPLLIDHSEMLRESIEKTKLDLPFELMAWVILPDHFHMIVNPLESDLSMIVKRIKLKFSASYRSANRLKAGRLWQYRYWDHVIRNQDDLNRHLDYMHYNPVKHGLVNSPFHWQLSSLHGFAEDGYYPEDWGVDEDPTDEMDVPE